jgi:predicted Zn-dependent protease with MMP-like domain
VTTIDSGCVSWSGAGERKLAGSASTQASMVLGITWLRYGPMPLRRRGSLARRHPSRRATEASGPPDAFERAVEAALDGLPPDIAALLGNVAVVVADWPTPEQARTVSGEIDHWLYGLYEGTPAVEWAADQVPFPNKITLFRGPLEEDFRARDELTEEIRRTVVHELAHHAGFEEARLRELGYE